MNFCFNYLRMELYSNWIVYLHCKVSLCSRQILSNGAYIPPINTFSGNIQIHHAASFFFIYPRKKSTNQGRNPFIRELSFIFLISDGASAIHFSIHNISWSVLASNIYISNSNAINSCLNFHSFSITFPWKKIENNQRP